MTFDHPRDYLAFADESRSEGRYLIAADYYVAAAHGQLMRLRETDEDPIQNGHTYASAQAVGRWARDLLKGILSYRLADEPSRSRNHAHVGLPTVTDIEESGDIFLGNEAEARKGLLHEISGDIRLYANLDGFATEFERAREYYDRVPTDKYDKHLGWQAEPEFDSLIRQLVKVADSVGYDIEDRTRERIMNLSLIDRIEYKREHYPAIVEQALDNGGW